jgi:hypothetical protein
MIDDWEKGIALAETAETQRAGGFFDCREEAAIENVLHGQMP